jgi:hypothetical protein
VTFNPSECDIVEMIEVTENGNNDVSFRLVQSRASATFICLASIRTLVHPSLSQLLLVFFLWRLLVGLPTPPSNIPVAAAEVCVHDG